MYSYAESAQRRNYRLDTTYYLFASSLWIYCTAWWADAHKQHVIKVVNPSFGAPLNQFLKLADSNLGS